ncbi:50S ribosomal protein L9 [candidate division KSB3 bacterium]|uniref:Large ribosomal subunit protein bL9 n=1 Tax=candidate division KSB3 bacterium TaxID=2044937 RepID=A0A2G6E0P4_9BACT|nr:MAG: 50S ribosomal protein L9 [candidate division KSB3 bacterium]PIE28344.1 MAG: 50S ribosomal protein L9 [candidate division KSB3 bacterium]
MEIILKDTVEKLGKPGDQVKVSDGYARNFLIPKGFAVKATKQNVARLEHERMLIAQKKQKELKGAEKLANKIRSLSCVLTRKVGEQEKLFGSVTSIDLAAFLEENGVEIDRKLILLDEPIKALGTHKVTVQVHPEVSTELKVKIKKEG